MSPTNGGGSGPWVAACHAYYKRFPTRADAERAVEGWERMGNCLNAHTITKDEGQ
jgi:hypothetical protein